MQSNIHLTPSELKQARELAEVHMQCWHETYTGLIDQNFLDSLKVDNFEKRWCQNLLNPTPQTLRLSLMHNQKIIGFCCAGPARNNLPGSPAEIYAIYLLRQNQGHGLGAVMMQCMARFILAQNWIEAHVWVLSGNHTSKFYEYCGGIQIQCTQFITLGAHRYEELCYHLDFKALTHLANYYP